MFKYNIPKVNEAISRTKKAIIALGCSFTQGHGAIADDIYKNYNWTGDRYGSAAIKWNLSESDLERLTTEYPDITRHWLDPKTAQPNWTQHELNNSFVNVLCNKYFNGEYAPINLSHSGCGNRATIKELYFYPDLLWDQIEECIVIYCPSGLERFDFMNDGQNQSANDHGRWTCMWPNMEPDRLKPKATLWEGYKEGLHSSRFDVLEQIIHVQELLLWCKFKKAKLIIVPAFSHYYDKMHFINSLNVFIDRSPDSREILTIIDDPGTAGSNEQQLMANMWPWENMFAPNGCQTFSDLSILQETPQSLNKSFYAYLGIGSPRGWITPCAHPGVKSHDLLASLLHKEILENIGHYEVNKRVGNF